MSEEQKTYRLAGIVFPDGDFSDQAKLFYEKREFCGDMGDGRMVQGELCSFAAWMNLFAAQKWYRYCKLGGLYLSIRGEGRCRLDIQGHTLSVVHGIMTETLVSLPCDFGGGGSLLVPVPDPSEMEGVSLRLFYEKDGFRMEEAAWCTDVPPPRQHRMAVACCTYQRERYVRKNIRKFEGLMAAHPELSGRLHLFVSDNGRTLPEGLSSEHVDVLPNVNAGGAGGFARGLMAANDGGYTRCIFMDDDVELCPESFLRVLALTEYFKEEYKDAFVNGAMMSLYDRILCFESVTVRNGFWLKGYHAHLPVDTVYGTLKCLNVNDDIYEEDFVSSSWWFACFSLDLYKGEYPIPCFIRGDDCEWSWRRLGVHHVSMNGICVWHTPFDFNVRRLVDHYFLPRNMFLVHSIHNPDFKEEWAGYLNGFFRHFMTTYNYISAELFLSALRDVLQGWVSFTEDPVELMARLKGICQKSEAKTCNDVQKLEEVRDIGPGGKDLGKRGIVVDWYPSENVFAFKKRMDVYNLITRSYEIRKPNPLREAWQADENDMLMLRIQKEYDGLLGHFREGFPKITGRKFWDGYLGISPKEELSASPVIEEHIHVEDGIDLLVALEDAILWMNSETLPIEQMGDAVREAVHHQLVQALEHHFARQRKEEAPEAEEIPQRRGTALHVSVKGMSEAASGMDFLEGMQEETLRKWQEDDTDFLREAARFHGAHGASEKNVAFLKECLENAARRYSDYRNVVVVEERE